MGQLRDRIHVITDLLLGAVHADHKVEDAEVDEVRKVLRELLELDKLPGDIEGQIDGFAGDKFDLAKAARDFETDPPIKKRRLLELVALVRDADEEIDLAEDTYLVALANALKMERSEYDDLVLDYEVEDLKGDFEALRSPSVDIDVDD